MPENELFISPSFERNYKNLPLSDRVPVERSPSGNLNTARHELQHVLVAKALGLQVTGVTVIPSGSYLGATFFSGNVSDRDLQIIAAAGEIGTGGGGGDRHTSAILDLRRGRRPGTGFSSAQEEARSILSSVDPLEMDIACEILAALGSVDSSTLPQLWARASAEKAMASTPYQPEYATVLRTRKTGEIVVGHYRNGILISPEENLKPLIK